MAWIALVLKTGVKLYLITGLSMLDMIEKVKRGGLCFVGSKRYSKANIYYLPDYAPEEEEHYFMYLDANNLYGWAMMQTLPYKDLKVRSVLSLRDNSDTPDECLVGYVLEVDCPVALHEKFREYQLAPE